MEYFALRSEATGGCSPISLASLHAAVSAETLPASVPEDVRQKFETARNLLVYSWFCYRFSPVATLELYQTFELGLRHALEEHGRQPPGLAKLFRLARQRGLLKSAKFRDRSPVVGAAPVSFDAPPEAFLDMMEKSMPTMRNHLAHGNVVLWADFTHTLRIVRDALIQLFPGNPPP